jgi:hypothetical protein
VYVKTSANRLNSISHLKDGFGLLKERSYSYYFDGKRDYFISLFFLDLHQQTLKKIHTVKYHSNFIRIFVNEADPTTFILNDYNRKSSQICKIVKEKIVFGEIIEIDFYPTAFYDKRIYGLKCYDDNGENLAVRLYIRA